MTNKIKLMILSSALALITLACGLNVNLPEDAITIGETSATDIRVQHLASDALPDLRIDFGAGELNLDGNSNGEFFVIGSATTNVEEIRPQVTFEGNEVRIEQGRIDYELTGLPNFNQIDNIWELHLASTPMTLDLRAGAFDGNFDFGGLALHRLDVTTGASNVDVDFSSPNAVSMEVFRFNTGASTVYLGNLGNANAARIDFKGGAGLYQLDFGVPLSQDLVVNIDAALSTLEISVPEGVPATVNVTSGLAAVNPRGAWLQLGEEVTYSQPGEGFSITFNVKLGAGNLDLEN